MADAQALRKAVHETGRIVQIGSQRRSTPVYQQAYEFINSGKFGDIVCRRDDMERKSAGTLAPS